VCCCGGGGCLQDLARRVEQAAVGNVILPSLAMAIKDLWNEDPVLSTVLEVSARGGFSLFAVLRSCSVAVLACTCVCMCVCVRVTCVRVFVCVLICPGSCFCVVHVSACVCVFICVLIPWQPFFVLCMFMSAS